MAPFFRRAILRLLPQGQIRTDLARSNKRCARSTARAIQTIAASLGPASNAVSRRSICAKASHSDAISHPDLNANAERKIHAC
jgi:hypothetical protein